MAPLTIPRMAPVARIGWRPAWSVCGTSASGTATTVHRCWLVWAPSGSSIYCTENRVVAEYLRDGSAIYERSFAIIRAETLLTRFTANEADVVVRMIHACGLVEAAEQIVFAPGLVEGARGALQAGAPILCDSEMVAHGVTRARLPNSNVVACTLRDERVPAIAARLGTTRSAAALELWLDRLAGAVVVIGNAPTALFRLLELLDAGAPRPAAILGMPVGFVGAAESKEELLAHSLRLPHLVVRGRLGGSAMAAAAVNALARSDT